jgi:FdhE protein
VPTCIPSDARQRLGTLVLQTPEWRPWLSVFEEALHAMQDQAWDIPVPEPSLVRPAAAALLDGITLTLDPRLAREWLRRLLGVAVANSSRDAGALALAARTDRLDALALLEATICQDEPRLTALSASVGVDPQALDALGHLAALPLLQACGRHLAGQVPPTWPYGYCPICGAWPALTEMRGLDRARHLRCARCGGDWAVAWLHCPYCHTTDHEQLGALVPEAGGETRKVDTCAACKGYVKAVTTLGPWPAYMVLIEDLDTVDLDVAAMQHGYGRPKRPGCLLTTRLVASPVQQRGIFMWRWGKR